MGALEVARAALEEIAEYGRACGEIDGQPAPKKCPICRNTRQHLARCTIRHCPTYIAQRALEDMRAR